jgi:HSP20 family molecular chaperone IbpA
VPGFIGYRLAQQAGERNFHMATQTALVIDSEVNVSTIYSQEEVSALSDSIKGAIQRRAYQFFEERDSQGGSDLGDWLRAEDEILFSAAPLVTLLDEQIDVRVDLGEWQLSDLTVGIEPFRMVVSGLTKTEVENQNHAFFRVVNLPTEIDPLNSSAAINNACLCVTLRRMQEARKSILL